MLQLTLIDVKIHNKLKLPICVLAFTNENIKNKLPIPIVELNDW